MPRTRLSGLPSLVEGSSDKGQQGDLTCLLDRGSHDALVARTSASLAARADLAILGDIAAEQVRLFVVNCQCFVCTELAGFGLCKEAAFSCAPWGLRSSAIRFSNFLAYEIRHAATC